MNKTTGLRSQNVFDVCLQEYGSLEPLFAFMQENGIKSFEYDIVVNRKYKIPIHSETQKFVVNYYVSNKIKIATGLQPLQGILLESGENILMEDGQVLIKE